jgi:ATP-binding cassette subfamily F protein uup
VFEGNGILLEYVGGYDDWLSLRKPPITVTGKSEKKEKPERFRPQRERQRTLTFRKKKEIEALPALIESLETARQAFMKPLPAPISTGRREAGSRR